MAKKLEAKLNLLEVVCIATGAMISSGLFILPGLAFAQAGPSVILSYLIAGFVCIPTILSMSELTSAMPKAGGDYFYITRGFGSLVGTLSGFASWFALSFKSAWALIGMGVYLSLLTPFSIEAIAVALCIFFVILNIVGVKEASKFQVILVVGLIGILLVYVLRGCVYINIERFTTFFPKGPVAMFSTAGFVFVAYGGLTKIVAMAEEIKKPERNLLLGMIISLSLTASLYVLVVLVTVGNVEPEILAGTLMPISKGAEAFSGGIFRAMIGVAASLAFLTTANAGIMSASRYMLGMSRDGHLPGIFQKISGCFKTPYVAILSTGLFMSCAILALKLEILVKIGSIIFLLLYILANATVILFRQSRISSYRPTFRSPLYPFIQIAGIIVTGFLLLEAETGVLFLTMVFFAAVAIFYRHTSYKKVVRDSALEHILKRLVSADKELTAADVPTELKNIVISRDNLEEKRYHQNLRRETWEKVIGNSNVIYIDEQVKAESLFRRISNLLASEYRLDKLALLKKFVEREKTSSTIVDKSVAMPHMTVDRQKVTKIIFVRAKTGIVFPNDQIVHTVIAVVTSIEQRPIHLQILAHFLKMIESPFFQTEWFLELEEKELKKKVFSFMIDKENRY